MNMLLQLGRRGRLAAGIAGLVLSWATLAIAEADDMPPTAGGSEGAVEVGDAAESRSWSIGSPIGPIEYRLGRGVSFGRTGLHVGGFATLEVDQEQDGPGEFALDGINFLINFQPRAYFRIFAELEVDDIFTLDLDTLDVESDPDARFERLYGDASFRDWANLRLGKFQTPVGRWNLVPAKPFVWTAHEPVVTERAFDEHTTGGLLFGSTYPGDNTFRYWLYGQFVDSFQVEGGATPDPADRSVGARVELAGPLGTRSVGASFLATEQSGSWSYLGGIDGQWHIQRFEWTFEAVYEDGQLADRNLWDVYLQSVLEVVPTFYLVARYEYFAPLGPEPNVNLADLGVAWIPKHFLQFRVGYRVADRQTQDVSRGVKAFFAVLF